MNCKKCGAPLVESDKFCKQCGQPVQEVNSLEQSKVDFNNIQQSVNMNDKANVTNDSIESLAVEKSEIKSNSNNEINNIGINSYASNNIQQQMNNTTGITGFQQSTDNSQNMNESDNYQQPMNSNFSNYQQPVNNMVNSSMSNNIQQPLNNYVNTSNEQPIYNQPKKNNNLKYILIGVGVVIIVAIITLVLVFAFSSKDNNKKTDTDDTVVNNNVDNNDNNSNYTVNYNGFTFKIPTNLVYETGAKALLLSNEEGTWVTSIEVLEGSYNQILSQKNQLQSIYQQQGYTASQAVEKNIGGMAFITLEISAGGTNALLGIAKANSMYFFGTTVYNIDNEFDYDVLEDVSSILSSAELNPDTNNISSFENIDLSQISEIAQ